jgi:AraC-like DNA-binding protein
LFWLTLKNGECSVFTLIVLITGLFVIIKIGSALGFDDPAYFTRFFKKQTGVSPNEFKILGEEINSSTSNAG